MLDEDRIGESPAWFGDVVDGRESSPQLVRVFVELLGLTPPVFRVGRGRDKYLAQSGDADGATLGFDSSVGLVGESEETWKGSTDPPNSSNQIVLSPV